MIARVAPRSAIRAVGALTHAGPDAPRRRINVDANGLSFGDRVRTLREAANLTQAELCELAGLGPNTVYEIERESYPTGARAHTLAAIARALRTTMDALWWGPATSEGSSDRE